MNAIIVYLSGPISDGETLPFEEQKANVFEAVEIRKQLMDAGFAVIMPHFHWFLSKHLQGTYKDRLKFAKAHIAASDVFLRIPRRSKGATAGVNLARSMKKPVFMWESIGRFKREMCG